MLAASTADAAPKVLLVEAPDGQGQRWHSAETRLRDELRLMEIQVEDVQTRPESIDSILLERGAQAAILLLRRGDSGRADIWVADPRGDAPQRQQLDAPSLSDTAVLALRTAESVRSHLTKHIAVDDQLLPLPSDSHVPPQPSVVPTPPPAVSPPILHEPAERVPRLDSTPTSRADSVAARAPPAMRFADLSVVDDIPPLRPSQPAQSRHRFRGLGVHSTLLGGPRSVLILLDLALTLRWKLTPLVSLQPGISAAVTPAQLTRKEGSIRMGLASAHMALVLTPGRADACVAPRIAFDGGLALAWAHGQATNPLHGANPVGVAGTLGGRVTLVVRMRARMHLLLGCGISVLLRPIAVGVMGNEVERLGPPLILGSLGIESLWPRIPPVLGRAPKRAH